MLKTVSCHQIQKGRNFSCLVMQQILTECLCSVCVTCGPGSVIFSLFSEGDHWICPLHLPSVWGCHAHIVSLSSTFSCPFNLVSKCQSLFSSSLASVGFSYSPLADVFASLQLQLISAKSNRTGLNSFYWFVHKRMLQLASPALCPFFVTSRFNLLKTLLVLVPLLPLYCSSFSCSSRLILLDCRYYEHDICLRRCLRFHLLIIYWMRRPVVIFLCCCPVFTFTHHPSSNYHEDQNPYCHELNHIEYLFPVC